MGRRKNEGAIDVTLIHGKNGHKNANTPVGFDVVTLRLNYMASQKPCVNCTQKNQMRNLEDI